MVAAMRAEFGNNTAHLNTISARLPNWQRIGRRKLLVMEYTSLNIHDQHLVCRMWKGWTHHVYLKLTWCGTKILERLVVTYGREIGCIDKRLEMAPEGLTLDRVQ